MSIVGLAILSAVIHVLTAPGRATSNMKDPSRGGHEHASGLDAQNADMQNDMKTLFDF